MRIIKRLDTFLLKAFLQLFAGTFFVCLFVFMMQFTWRYLEELIGKGLSTEVLAKFFWYAGITLVPMSLPLAILLASLITFGNLGEKLELLSMKAAGIPLLRILQPLLIFVGLLSAGSFYFQNRIGPEATKKLAALVWSMKQKSPELEIPEGQFYSAIPGYNIYVEKKDSETGMLYGVMIYTNTGNYEETQIVLADSARLQSTAEKRHLQLTLYAGERFRNMDARTGNMMKASVPYMRETFEQEIDLIPFDANFDLMNAEQFSHNAATKDIKSISKGIDSLSQRIDSMGHAVYAHQLSATMRRDLGSLRKDTLKIAKQAAKGESFDSIYIHLPLEKKQAAMRQTQSTVKQLKAEYDFRRLMTDEENHTLRLHRIEWHKKFTLSVACLVFFFIGAPLGAIIRKGGLGVPVIVSVLIFIFYYIVNVSGEKMAKSGQWVIPFGVWLSSMVLAPIGAFLTIKSNNDSVVFNIEGYKMFFMRLLGLRSTRKLNRKEVVINDPNYPRLLVDLQQLKDDCQTYVKTHHLMSTPNYVKIFFHYAPDTIVKELNDRMETLIDELHNSQDARIIAHLNELPILSTDAHTRPFNNQRRNIATGIFLPLGLFFYFRIWRYRIRLRRDMEQIQETVTKIITRIKNTQHE